MDDNQLMVIRCGFGSRDNPPDLNDPDVQRQVQREIDRRYRRTRRESWKGTEWKTTDEGVEFWVHVSRHAWAGGTFPDMPSALAHQLWAAPLPSTGFDAATGYTIAEAERLIAERT